MSKAIRIVVLAVDVLIIAVFAWLAISKDGGAQTMAVFLAILLAMNVYVVLVTLRHARNQAAAQPQTPPSTSDFDEAAGAPAVPKPTEIVEREEPSKQEQPEDSPELDPRQRKELTLDDIERLRRDG